MKANNSNTDKIQTVATSNRKGKKNLAPSNLTMNNDTQEQIKLIHRLTDIDNKVYNAFIKDIEAKKNEHDFITEDDLKKIRDTIRDVIDKIEKSIDIKLSNAIFFNESEF